ncbi:unnamed protein product [Urochloa decumbens]|uniref:Uncharacterized protein n=1 Tax=Urochloa decumbens TaxID=240449 RepID=A0ABC9FPA2_9POAL
MSTTSGSPDTPSRRRPSARCHSSGSPGTPSRRRASARGRSGGRARDSEAKMEEMETVLAQEQVEKMKRVAARALDKVVSRARESATRSLAAANAKGAISGSLNESLLMPQSTCNTNLTPTPSSTSAPAIGSDMVAVTNPPMPKVKDEIWNKRQIMYILVLTTTVGVMFLMYPLLPPSYGRLILLLVAAVWGVAIVGLPCGLYGTSRCEDRHVGWLISTLFAVFMIYCFYVVALRVNGTSAPAPSSSSLDGTDSSDDFWFMVAFGVVGSYVLVGYLWAWFRACWTGGDRDLSP